MIAVSSLYTRSTGQHSEPTDVTDAWGSFPTLIAAHPSVFTANTKTIRTGNELVRGSTSTSSSDSGFTGRYYYEVTVEQAGLAQVGWVDAARFKVRHPMSVTPTLY